MQFRYLAVVLLIVGVTGIIMSVTSSMVGLVRYPLFGLSCGCVFFVWPAWTGKGGL